MSVVAVLNSDEDFVRAIGEFNKFLELDLEVISAPSLQQIDNPTSVAMFLVHQEKLEDPSGLRIIEKLRSSQIYHPVLLVSPSPPAYLWFACRDLEYVYFSNLPFKSGTFINDFKFVLDRCRAHHNLFEKRREIALHFSHFRYRRAIPEIKDLSKTSADSFTIHLLLAEACAGLKSHKDAASQAKKALSFQPDSLKARALLAQIYHEAGKSDEAVKLLHNSLKIANQHVGNLVQLGQVYMDQGKMRNARSMFEKAQNIDGTQEDVYKGVMTLDLIEGKIEHVDETLKSKSVSIDLAKFCNLRGISLVKKGQYRMAETLYNNAMKFLPDPDLVYKMWMNLGLCMKKAGRWNKAIEYFEKCNETAPIDYHRATEQIEFIEKHHLNKKTS